MKTFLLPLLAISLISCANPESRKTTVELGTQFAQALVDGRYAQARSLLTNDLQQQYPSAELESRYKQMIAYGGAPAKVDGYTSYESMFGWRAHRPGDLGWVYVSISGPGYGEAVTVIVSNENGSAKIRNIEWGRP